MSHLMFKTDELQKRNQVPLSNDEWHEHKIRRRPVSNQQLTQYQSPLLIPEKDATEMKKRLLYSLVGADQFGKNREQVAIAMTQLALAYNLNPFNGEIWAIPQFPNGFSVYVGYKGLHRAARNVARNELRTDFIFGKADSLQPDEIQERWAQRCTRCGGSGKFKSGKNCTKCAGGGLFDPKEVVVVRIPLSLLSKVTLAKEHSIEFEPTWGIGVWQPGDNIAEGRDPTWMATKRAKADALRQEFDLPFSYGEPGREAEDTEAEWTVIDPSDNEPHPVVEAAKIAGITYDDEEAFIEVVCAATHYLGYESAGHVMEAFLALEQTHLAADELKVAGSVLEHWLTQQEAEINQEAAQAEMPLEEAA